MRVPQGWLPRSLQVRLALSIGILLTVLWTATAALMGLILQHEMDEVFDSALQETAQRLLPLAAVEIVGRDDEGNTQRLGEARAHEEFFTYLVRDINGGILLQSHDADPKTFPAYDGPGFRLTSTHRLYSDEALQGSIRITVAEPLDHRALVAREIQMGLGLPALIMIPLALLCVVLVTRANLTSMRRFRDRLAARSAHDLSAVPGDDVPSEIAPLVSTLNTLLQRLASTFEAERSFAANAAHELRTPLAGAIAQAQRLRSETSDRAAQARAAEIEATLKRMTRLSERLMQLARAEGGRLRIDVSSDLRIAARVVIEDMARMPGGDRITVDLPATAVMSDLDPDAFAILCRNLVDNGMRHGEADGPVSVRLTADGTLTVTNDGPVVPARTLARLTHRFERAKSHSDGSGLGLAIVAAIADRINAPLRLTSPRSGSEEGFEVSLTLPVRDIRSP